ncbi:MAG: hypothetical protein O6941_02720 [Planctomycetota bacterium]|nr:hypothetical protein [Planctomycetota bacterium]
MSRDRAIQLLASVLLVASTMVCGSVLPSITDLSQKHSLRYTDVVVEGAPPFVALGTAIGALRGIIVDYLWIKVHLMKQEGLYYEVMADADLITKLQPRFAAVWAFHGHNMAYNISVAHNTSEERWEWVKAGINLVRNKGLRYNPNDLQLHKELAFWLSHKIEGVSDDAHLYYKTEFAREWHSLLGEPPYEHEARIVWIKKVADAPETLDQAQRRTPGVMDLVERLRRDLSPYEQRFSFALDKTFLQAHAEWQAARGPSFYARFRGIGRGDDPFFRAFDEIASDPEAQPAWDTLIAHVRKRVLVDEYNMDPQLMYEYTRDYGPIDWRTAHAHALYWALKGEQHGENRVAVDDNDVYRIVNNDRAKIHAMQGMARWGRISFDPFSSDLPARLPDPRWIEVIDWYWETISAKHKDTRGPGPDLFMGFHQNFLSSAVRELYRSGETALAQKYLDRLNSLYGMGARQQNPKYDAPLDIFVWREVEGEYEFQPHIAPSEVAASLRYGFRVGIGQGRPEVFQQAVKFANDVTVYFREHEYIKYETKLGTERMAALITQLEDSVPNVFAQLMIDSTVGLLERLAIYNYKDLPDEYRLAVYDDIYPHVLRQFQASEIGNVLTIEQALPAPPGLEEYRRMKAIQAAREAEEARQREGRPSAIERR